MDTLTYGLMGLGGGLYAAFLTVIFVTGRWAHRRHGISAGYWILALSVSSTVIGLSAPPAQLWIIDNVALRTTMRLSIGQVIALNSYSSLVPAMTAKLLMAVLLCSELLTVLSGDRTGLNGMLSKIARLHPRRHQLGALAIGVGMVHPLFLVVAWLLLRSTT